MPWEISIVQSDREQPLGTKQDVTEWLFTVLAGVELGRPPCPPNEFFAWLPESIRNSTRTAFESPRLEGVYEDGDLSIEFHCADEDPVRFLNADVRGEGNPLPALARLCVPKRWMVINGVDESSVDMSNDSAHQWERFRAWRDRAIGQFE